MGTNGQPNIAYFNYYKSLSGIETVAKTTYPNGLHISITTNPYQGLKPDKKFKIYDKWDFNYYKSLSGIETISYGAIPDPSVAHFNYYKSLSGIETLPRLQ